MIYMTRKLEALKLKLVQNFEDYNLYDAFGILTQDNLEGKVNQYEFRQAMLKIGVKSDRVSMDKVYLFF